MRHITLIFVTLSLVIGITAPIQAQDCSAQDADAWVDQALNDYDLGNYEEAVDAYTCVIELNTNHVAYAYTWRAESYRILGERENAYNDIARALELDSGDGSTYLIRANLYLNDGSYPAAISDYTNAINIGDIDLPWAYSRRGIAYYYLDELDLSRQDNLVAIALDPANDVAYNNLGVIFYESGDMNGAIEYFELAIKNTDNIEFPSLNLGYFNYERGDYPRAITYYTNILDANPEFTNAYIARSKAYIATQNPTAYADLLRWVQFTQTSITDIPATFGFKTNERLAITPGAVYRVTLELNSGSLLTVAATSPESEVDPLLVLLGTSGAPIFGDDDSGSDEDAVINRFPIAETGTYTLLITHSNEGDTGEILLSMNTFADDRGQTIIPYQLAIGETAEIYAVGNSGPGILNVREYPSIGFQIVEKLDSGDRVTIINGPQKNDDFVWWQIETEDGVTGWVAEYLGGVQTLFPALQVGGKALINTGAINIRAEPTTNGDPLQELAGIFTVNVVDGPVTADGYTWWKIRTESGNVEGWVVERANNTHTLIARLSTYR